MTVTTVAVPASTSLDVDAAGGVYRVTTTVEQVVAPSVVASLVVELPAEEPVPSGTTDLALVARYPGSVEQAEPGVPVVEDLWNVSDLMGLSGRPFTAVTAGWGSAADGGGMTWEIRHDLPPGPVALTSVPTADERWAVPVGLPTSPPPPVHSAAVLDMIRRGRTFQEEGGTSLIWDASRRGPGLSTTPVHSSTTSPYPITCSHLVGMVLAGWEYASTTYVQDGNERTGWYSPLGLEPSRASIWQAHRAAHHFWRRGRLWLAEDPSTLRAGDVLFFSQHDPESTWDRVRARTLRPYFGNVYHTAIYLGGGRILQSTGPSSPTGVWETDISSLESTLAWAARPEWVPPEYVTLSVLVDGLESPVATTL